MNNLMGGEAIAHEIIGPWLGCPRVSEERNLGVISVTGNRIIIDGRRKLGPELYCQISIVT